MAARRVGRAYQRHSVACPAVRGDGRCRCAGSWCFRLIRNGRRVGQGGFASKREAEAALAEVVGQAARGRLAQPSREGFTAFALRYLEAQAPRLKPATVDHYRRIIDLHLEPWFDQVPLRDVRRDSIERLVAAMSADGRWSPKTIANVLVVVKAILSTAVRWELISASPAAGVAPPRREREEVNIPSADEVARALAACEDRYRLGFLLAAHAGLRRGEVLALRFEDVDLGAGKLLVRRSYNRHGLQEPKTRAGRRVVPLGPALVAALADARAAREELEDEPGWVLATPTGDHLAPEVLDRAWRRAQRRAEVPHRPIHALRHHAISRMIEAGFSPKEVQVAAGHASITTTFDRYGHIMPGTLAGQRERLAELDARGERATAPAREQAGSTDASASAPADFREHAGSTDAPERIASTGPK